MGKLLKELVQKVPKLSNKELELLDILVWEELNKRDPEYFSLENSLEGTDDIKKEELPFRNRWDDRPNRGGI